LAETVELQSMKNVITRWGGIIVGLMAIAIYCQTCDFGYVLDDQIVLSENKFVQNGASGIDDILTTEGFVGYFGEQRSLVVGDRYRPLSLITFALEQEIAPRKPWLSHFLNTLLYGLLGWLIFSFISYMIPVTKKKEYWLVPIIAAGLFVLHPIHVEAVANIKGRDEILASIFYVLTLYYGVKSYQSGKKIPLIFVAVFAFLSSMAKEYGVTLLVMLPLTLWLFNKGKSKEILFSFGAVGIGVAGYLVMRMLALGYLIPPATVASADLMNNPFLEMNSGQQWATTIYTWLKYYGLLLFPHPLTHDYYPYHIPIKELKDGAVILSSIITIALLAIPLIVRKKNPWVSWGIVLFFLTLLPASNAIFPVGTFMNERFLFLPSLGIVSILAWYLGSRATLDPPWRRTLALIAVGLISVLFLIKTITRIPDWRSGQTLNQSAIKVSDNSARINLFVATDYFNAANATNDRSEKKRLLDLSKKHLEKAVRIYPIYGSAHNMLSGTCAEQFKIDGKIKPLLKCFKEVATYRPGTEYLNQFLTFLKDRGDYVPELIQFYVETGYNRLYTERNNFPHAIRFLREADALQPGNRDVYEKLGNVYFSFGSHLQEYPDPKYPTADIINSGKYFARKAQEM